MKQKGIVWVTGGSSGLGLQTAEALAADGWRVLSGARSFPEEADKTQNPVRLRLDVTDQASADAFVQRALAIEPRVDALVCAAAVLVLGSCEKTGMDELEAVMRTNFLGAARMVRLALPHLREAGRGRIVLFSSINGLLGVPFQGAYTASKHALEGYAECLQMECAPMGVRVTLVEPGDHRGGSQRTRLHAGGEDAASPYREAYRGACAVIARDEACGLSPEALGRKVARLMGSARPRFRLRVAKPDQRLAVLTHRFLPAHTHFAILRGYYANRGGKQNG